MYTYSYLLEFEIKGEIIFKCAKTVVNLFSDTKTVDADIKDAENKAISRTEID